MHGPDFRKIATAGMVLLGAASCGEPATGPLDDGRHIWPLPPPDSLLVVQEWHPACSPDGRVVAYSHEVKPGHEGEFGTFGIYRVDLGPDSVGTPELVVPISGAYWLSFAPDSRRIVYGWNLDIWVADVFSKEVWRLTNHTNGQKPSWHPRDDRIVYNRVDAPDAPADSGAIRLLDVATGEDRPIHTRSGRVLYGEAPAWDPAGRSVAYTRYVRATGGLELFRVFPDSSEEIQITSLGWRCQYPKWLNDGRSILVRTNPGGVRDPEFPDWWIIPESGEQASPFYDSRNQIEVGANMAVGPGAGEFVLTRPSSGNEHWLGLWIVGLGLDDELHWRQVTGPRAANP